MASSRTGFNKFKRDNVPDSRLTTCAACRRGIFKDQEKIWTSIGLVHTPCNEDVNN